MQILDNIAKTMTAEKLTLNDILSRLMFQRKICATELARQVNIPQPTLSRIMSGATANPHLSSLKALASYFNLSIQQLKGLQPIPGLASPNILDTGLIKIPILNYEQAKQWLNKEIPTTENQQIFIEAHLGAQCYALKLKDASMEPQFPQQTTLIIDPLKPPKDRAFVVATIESYPEVIFRQLLIDGPYHYLKPISPDFDKFKMLLLGKNDKVAGVLVQARRDYFD